MSDDLEDNPIQQDEQPIASDIPTEISEPAENPTDEIVAQEPTAPATYQGTARDMVTNSSQGMFDHFMNSNYTPEQQAEIYKQIEDARAASNGNFTASWQGSDSDQFDKVEITYRNGQMTNFEMHNRDEDEISVMDRHIEYDERRHSARVKTKDVTKADGTTTTTRTYIKAHDDNRFKTKETHSQQSSQTDLTLTSPSYTSDRTRTSHSTQGDSDGSLAIKDKTSQLSVAVGTHNDLSATGNTHRVEYDADGNVTRTKDTQTSLQLGSTNQFTTSRTTNRTQYDDDGNVVKTKNIQTNLSLGEDNQYASTTHTERHTTDEDGNVIATRITDNSLTIDQHGLNEQYQTTRTVINDDGTQSARTNSMGLAFDGTTITGSAGHATREIDAEGVVTEEHTHDLALTAGRVYGAQVDINHMDADHTSHFTAGARFGAGAAGADFERSYKDDTKELNTQMHASYDVALRQADASVNIASRHLTDEGTRESSFNANVHVDPTHTDMAFSNQSLVADQEGQVLAQRNTNANLHAEAHQAGLTYSDVRINEQGTETRTLNSGFDLSGNAIAAAYQTTHTQNDAEGNVTLTHATDLAIAGDSHGFTANTKRQNDGHVVENEAHANISGLPEGGVSHTVTDDGEVRHQMRVDTDKAYAILGDMAQNGLQQVTGMTQQFATTIEQTDQALATTKESAQQMPVALQQMRIRSM